MDPSSRDALASIAVHPHGLVYERRPSAGGTATAALTSAGLVDLQVNGFAGVDFNDPQITADALDHALATMLTTGVTACLPTIITAARPALHARLRALDAAVSHSRLGGRMIAGYHLEGPFLSPRDGFIGCHPADAMVPPSVELIDALEAGLTRPIRLITLAPELEGAIPFIEAVRARGKLIAIGHADVSPQVLAHAVSAGASMCTHLGNAVPHRQHKFDNPLVHQLAQDGLVASFIADGHHVPPDALKVFMRAKGHARCLLVTDAVAAAAAPPGLYVFAGRSLRHEEDGRARDVERGMLAGSALCLDQAVRNLMDFGIASLREAIALASERPRQLLASIGVDLPSSRVVWNERGEVMRVEVGPADGEAALSR